MTFGNISHAMCNLGQVYSQSVGSRPDIRWTKEGPSYDDDSYLGYSIAHGEFSGK